jgi:hypothetical protein
MLQKIIYIIFIFPSSKFSNFLIFLNFGIIFERSCYGTMVYKKRWCWWYTQWERIVTYKWTFSSTHVQNLSHTCLWSIHIKSDTTYQSNIFGVELSKINNLQPANYVKTLCRMNENLTLAEYYTLNYNPIHSGSKEKTLSISTTGSQAMHPQL